MSSRNPLRHRVAIAAAASTGFTAANTERTPTDLTAQACISVMEHCGIRAADIDGLCGSAPSSAVVQSTLGIPRTTWSATPSIPIGNHIAAAAAAVHSGLASTVLLYHASYRMAWNTSASQKDPFRRIASQGSTSTRRPESIANAAGYPAWASRYLHEFNVPRTAFGLVAINDRSNAIQNPLAVKRTPITMDDYLCARMIREPLCLLDMDIAVDGADAFIITTPERARDMPLPPVLIDAIVLGQTDRNDEDQLRGLDYHGQNVVVDALRAKSEFWIDDVDVYFPYDGFTFLTLSWIENTGWCARGEGGDFLRQHWDVATNRALIDSRIPINPHGGSLSEGATQGSGHVREAVHQLQGQAGDRQVEGARRALITLGGFFFNAQGVTLIRG
ncbi:thiolase family protein [Mycolicibacterium moriokaense]|uniref:Acetyl-CoA acetyltransferase n=1 Tax=Mycolicibacterium moriokaense TaxID=39691 RepID=A0A318H8L8_9MYCO|nr:thiolase family protein [Mycolicibacterium moriokaense]PXX01669.1 acetyl-CoA acetyltransferase [Mycolicibacterium moriokaense]